MQNKNIAIIGLVIVFIASISFYVLRDDGVDEDHSAPDLYPASDDEEYVTAETATESEELSTGGRGQLDATEIIRFDAPYADISYAHVAPGEYSEVYVILRGEAGRPYNVQLYRETTLLESSSIADPYRSGFYDENGEVRLTWRITQYGMYTVGQQGGGETDMTTIEDRAIASIVVE